MLIRRRQYKKNTLLLIWVLAIDTTAMGDTVGAASLTTRLVLELAKGWQSQTAEAIKRDGQWW